jgi:hypothetical protein
MYKVTCIHRFSSKSSKYRRNLPIPRIAFSKKKFKHEALKDYKERCTSGVMLSNSLTTSVNFAISSSSMAAAISCHQKM